MNLALLSAAIAAAIGFGTAWSIQSQRLTKLELTYAKTRIASAAAARKVLERVTLQVVTAQNDAVDRGRVLRADADAARSSGNGLRQSSSDTMRAVTDDSGACTAAIAVYDHVLSEISLTAEQIAIDADLWESAAITLHQAWPR